MNTDMARMDTDLNAENLGAKTNNLIKQKTVSGHSSLLFYSTEVRLAVTHGLIAALGARAFLEPEGKLLW